MRTLALSTTLAIYRYLRQHPSDIVQTCLFQANWHGRIAARLAGVPVVIAEEHSLHESAAGHVRYNPLLGGWFRLADRVDADAHLKRQIMGREVVVAITDGKLDFGPWEQIYYAEFDGRRKKRVLVKVIGE